MPTFRIRAHRYIEQFTMVEVEAEHLGAIDIGAIARDLASGRRRADWSPGDDVVDEAVYAVEDGAGNEVWTR